MSSVPLRLPPPSRGLWQMYVDSLERNPVLTKALTSCVLSGGEELNAQLLSLLPRVMARRISSSSSSSSSSSLSKASQVLQSLPGAFLSIDFSKVLKFAVYGLVVSGPLGHFLYSSMEKALPGDRAALVGLKFLATNAIIIPFQTFVYLVALGLINNDNITQLKQRLQRNFAPILITTWKYFPLIQLLTFSLLPPALWLPFFNLLGFIYGVYLNAKSSSK